MLIRGEPPKWRPPDSAGRRLLWLFFRPPELTTEIVLREARKLGMVSDLDFGDGRTSELSVKLAGITGEQSIALRDACLRAATLREVTR